MKKSIYLPAIIACILWSTAFVGVKIGLQYFKPLSLAGIRFILAGLLLIPFCGSISNYFKVIRSNLKAVLIIAFVQTFLLYTFFFIGLSLVSGSMSAIIIGSSPVFAVLLAHFFMEGDRITTGKVLSIALGIAGVIIITLSRKPWSEIGQKQFLGMLLLILGSISSAGGNIIVAKYKKDINPFILNSAQIFIGGFFLFFVSLPIEGLPDFRKPVEFYLILIWLSVVSAVAFSIWFMLLKKPGVKVSQLNIWKFIIPVLGAGLSWIILKDESPSILAVVGMVFVSSSIFISNKSAKSKISLK